MSSLDLIDSRAVNDSENLFSESANDDETEVELKEAMAKITVMETQSDDLKELLETKEGEFVQSLDELENDLAEKFRQVDEYKKNINKLEKSVETLKTDLDLKSKHCSQSDTNIHLLEETIENLKNDIDLCQYLHDILVHRTKQELSKLNQ